eukprot:TRINITY_DN4915_c0_g1_i1.p1 TRINITY_DN4915_c0_g1~~TRINITY_DN4915_c0_g1_i1.p1  ORF type:complete len:504 (+),score=136.60 TRINITY_DN4915_c0_g1_i1:183-1694(+)
MKVKSSSFRKKNRHNPLYFDIQEGKTDETRIRKRFREEKPATQAQEKSYIDSNTSKKILKQARAQLDEEEEEDEVEVSENEDIVNDSEEGEEEEREGEEDGEALDGDGDVNFDLEGEEEGDEERPDEAGNEDEDEEIDEEHERIYFGSDSEKDETESVLDETESVYAGREVEVSEEDERALAMFMNPNPQPRRLTIADLIMEKIREKEEMDRIIAENGGVLPPPKIKPQVRAVYRRLANLLKTYTSGKIPRAFKIIPTFKDWEEVLYITRPEEWTPQATREATKIFVMGLNTKMAQRFFSVVLYPKVREDIAENKRLNFHYFLALKKALYRPAAFFKGILLPMCESGDCTLREAVIIGSVLKRNSIPVLHSSVAILKIAEMRYSGTNSYFLRVLLDKKYALPYRVIDSLVDHFMRFLHDTRNLPVVWHQALLAFAQRYKLDITLDQKERLKPLLRLHSHHLLQGVIITQVERRHVPLVRDLFLFPKNEKVSSAPSNSRIPGKF